MFFVYFPVYQGSKSVLVPGIVCFFVSWYSRGFWGFSPGLWKSDSARRRRMTCYHRSGRLSFPASSCRDMRQWWAPEIRRETKPPAWDVLYKTLWILGYLLHQLVNAEFLNHQQYLNDGSERKQVMNVLCFRITPFFSLSTTWWGSSDHTKTCTVRCAIAVPLQESNVGPKAGTDGFHSRDEGGCAQCLLLLLWWLRARAQQHWLCSTGEGWKRVDQWGQSWKELTEQQNN